MQGIHLKYVQEEYDSNGTLTKFHLNAPENFNFAYDVVDELARTEPDRTALVWCGADGSERRFTFAEIKEYSDRAAAFL